MKHFYFFVVLLSSVVMSSCCHTVLFGVGHDYAKYNLDKRLQSEEYRIVGPISGEARAVYFLGLGGLSADAKKLAETSYKNMIHNAGLEFNQAIVNVSSEMRIGVFSLIGTRTVYTHGTVIEFLNNASYLSTNNIHKNGIYKIGDIYSEGKVKGVVIDISEGGKHGKIISLKNATKVWSTTNYHMNATNENYGKENCKLIARAESSLFPAINQCFIEGAGWYLPSLAEMQQIYKNLDVINDSLKNNGGAAIKPTELYWTSTEISKEQAIATQSAYYSFENKSTALRIVAMYEF